MELALTALIIVATALAVALLTARFVGSSDRKRAEDQALALLQGQINASMQQTTQQIEAFRGSLNESMQSLSRQLSGSLAESSKAVGERIEGATRVIGDVRQQLGQLKESSQQLVELGKDISKLENILQPPKLRGGLGELFLNDLLAQTLPSAHYQTQYRFKGGEIVDAVVILRDGMVPIDAKFPLDNFRKIMAAHGDDERKSAKKAFIRDVKGHIDAISAKYVRTDENTFDFALMYVQAENVYYETIIKDDEFGDDMSLFSYALKKRVIPVSPNSFYAYLQTVLLGLKGMRVEERSREILDNLARLQKDFENFSEPFRVLGQHLDNSAKKYAEAQRRFDKLETKIEQIDGMARGIGESDNAKLPSQPPPRLDGQIES